MADGSSPSVEGVVDDWEAADDEEVYQRDPIEVDRWRALFPSGRCEEYGYRFILRGDVVLKQKLK